MNDRQVFGALTPRESDILAALVEGLSNREIADKLFVAPSTIKWYIKQIYNKLGVNSRQEAAQITERYGLLADDTLAIKVKHNLPAQTTPFIGRERELDELATLVAAQKMRLVTILAPGGMGKTRLALEAAEQQVYSFVDGVFFISLTPLANPEQIVGALGDALEGFQFYPGSEPQQQLLDYLKRKQLLLVLDNYEHLLDGAPLVSTILSAAPEVQVLVTSRERLNLQGEAVYVLSGMEFSDWKTLEAALEYDAVRLFLDTAQRVRPGFTIAADNLEYLAHICRMVEGMPLGAILAAAWVDVLSLREIAGYIQESFEFLEAEMRDAPDHHQSIRAVFEPTWARLSMAERSAFMQLTVFRGGCALAGAEGVSVGVRTLQGLTHKALVTRSKRGRYDIHELLRQYGEAKLRENPPDYAAARDAHLNYYVTYLTTKLVELRGIRFYATLAEVDSEFENLLVAWEWACTYPEHHEKLWTLWEGLFWWTWMGSRFVESLALFRMATTALQKAGGNPQLMIQLKGLHAFLYFSAVENAAAHSALQEIVPLLEHLKREDYRREIMILIPLTALVAAGVGDVEVHQRLARLTLQAIDHCRAQGWDFERALALGWYATPYVNRWLEADARDVRPLLDEALQVFRALQQPYFTSLTTVHFGSLALLEGDYAAAEEQLLACLELPNPLNRSAGLCWLVEVSLCQGNGTAATRWCLALLELLAEANLVWNRDFALLYTAKVLALRGQAEHAVEALGCARVEISEDFKVIFKNPFIQTDLLDGLVDEFAPEVYSAVLARGQASDPQDMIERLLILLAEENKSDIS